MTEEILQELWDKQKGICSLTGQMMKINDKRFQPSIDRIDSTKGYTKENIRLVCWIINHIKGDLSDAEFIKASTAVAMHNNAIVMVA